MKRDMVDFVSKRLVCQQVKVEHQRPTGLHQSLEVPEWKWEQIAMDFVMGLPKTSKGSDAIWVTVDRLTKSEHFYCLRQLMGLLNMLNYTLMKLFGCMGHHSPLFLIVDHNSLLNFAKLFK